MSGNSSTELIMNVGQAGEYHYKLYQATENKENYTYDSKTYDVTIEGFFDSNNELMAVTVVKNENGDKVSKVHLTHIPVKLVKIKTRFHLPQDQRILFIMVRR